MEQTFKVLMLGWEYPPHISGGLGTACFGLTQALAKKGIDIELYVPSHQRGQQEKRLSDNSWQVEFDSKIDDLISLPCTSNTGTSHQEITVRSIPATLSPYDNNLRRSLNQSTQQLHYGRDLFAEVNRFTSLATRLADSSDFDIVHAHDWMTFKAASMIAKKHKKPFLAHVHSLENDRSGDNADPRIAQIEREGIHRADKVISVSHYTQQAIQRLYQITGERFVVIHNGGPSIGELPIAKAKREKKLVLFLGRLTSQKGPEHFVAAARRVLNVIPDTTFIMAGDGDLLDDLKKSVKILGMDKAFSFPGFLSHEKVGEMYARATVYVMPSVSEPFGIAPLEAVSCGTPAILSRHSGVSEVLTHSLLFDFWDIDKLALYIINTLTYPEIGQDMIKMAQQELRDATWERAAQSVVNTYTELV